MELNIKIRQVTYGISRDFNPKGYNITTCLSILLNLLQIKFSLLELFFYC